MTKKPIIYIFTGLLIHLFFPDVNYQQNKSTSHNSTKLTNIIVTESVINVDHTSVQILKDKSTEKSNCKKENSRL